MFFEALTTTTGTDQGLPQVASVVEKAITEKNQLDIIADADPVVQITLLILVVMSIACWAIIFYKYRQIKQAQNNSQGFWNTFAQTDNMQNLSNASHSSSGPLFEIFNSALLYVPRLKKIGKPVKEQRENLYQKLAQAREEEVYKLEQYTPFLATTASTAPFIGLFGTVWGILTAFYAIGKVGSSSLTTVGPYISEALIATAVGLAAAIPAVIGFNYFVHKIKIITKMMDLFVDDLVIKIEQEESP